MNHPHLVALLLLAFLPSGIAKDEQSSFTIPPKIDQLLEQHCFSCHDEDTQKGEVQLNHLRSLSLERRLDLLNKVQEQVFFKEMPPAKKKKKKQPAESERAALTAWISGELKKHDASGLEEKLARPEFGNYVDHRKLFSGEFRDLPAFTFARRWLISEHIFNAKVNRLLDYEGVRTIDGTRITVAGDNGVGLGTRFGGGTLRQSIVNPFLLPKTIGVRYYDNTAYNSGHLLTMIANAKKIAGYMSSEPAMRKHYPALFRIMEHELLHREILRTRKHFLETSIVRVSEDLYGEQNEKLLPKVARVEVVDPQVRLDAKGKPRKKENNLGLLDRYDGGDMRAIYLGIDRYTKDGVTFDRVVEQCERDWFVFGIAESRIRQRVGIMKALHTHWSMALIYEDIARKNLKPAPYRPLATEEMDVVHAAVRKHRKNGDTYQQVIDKCLTNWETLFREERKTAGQARSELLGEAVAELFLRIHERGPTSEELRENVALTKSYLERLGTQEALAKLIETLILNSEFVYRSEFGHGDGDEHGRRILSPREGSYALAYALTDSSPDAQLVSAVTGGRLNTREDYRREVKRMLKRRDQFSVIDEAVQKNGFNSSITNMPIRELRFFREFFGYPKVMTLFKDDVRFGAGRYDGVKGRLVDEADMLVAHILEKDRNVFEELLTTEKFYVYHSGNNEAMKAASERIRTIYDYFKDEDWKNFTEEELYAHWEFIDKMKMRGTVFPNFLQDKKRRTGWVGSFKRQMASFAVRFGNRQAAAVPFNSFSMHFRHKGNASTRTGQQMRGPEVSTFFGIDHRDWDYPTTQPAKVPNRKGMLTHPAWLIAHAQNTETDPVRRGKWIREKLLAGTIPDIPITVDAVIPEDHHKTLRQRLENRTGQEYCWKCHQKMDPLGLPFEIFDAFGRYRTEEQIEHPENLIKGVKQAERKNGIQIALYKTLPVDPRSSLEGTGDENIDGEVRDAVELTERLAKSPLVRQSIIRHAFRYFLGRNEMLSDSKTLMDAEHAYLKSGGSFDAVIVSFLTSDSFLYRKPPATN